MDQTPQTTPPVEPTPPTPPTPPVQQPTPIVTPPGSTPAASAAPVAPTPKKELTPEEKKAKRQAMFKRLGIVCTVTYVLVLLLIFGWAALSYGKEFSLFDYLPVSQISFSAFLMTVFNVMVGALVVILMLLCLFNVLKSLLTKKEELEKKKQASRRALYSGLSFFLLAVLWLVGIWFLGPRLIVEERFGSPIITDPETTIGLTSPITITFDASEVPVDTDTYSILAYSWNFGDGSTANGQTTSHEYTQKATGNGIYSVTLTVTYMDLKSGEQFEYETSVDVVIENELTAASFVASPESGDIPLEVTFDASSSYDPDGEIVAYDWDLDGDGDFDDGEGDLVSYEYTQEGDYEVTLRVTDNNGEYATTSLTIEAGSVGGLRAVITAPLPEGESYYVDEEYEFDGKLSQIESGSIKKYTWDFGDGSTTVSTRTVTHSFDSAGTYEVTLTVQDGDGNTDADILEVVVVEEGEAPTAEISTDPAASGGVVEGTVPFDVEFDASGSTDPEEDIVDYEWDFDGDGEVDDTGDIVTYTYEEVGTYEATLLVRDSVGNEDETSISVEVTAQGVIAVLESDSSSGEVPLTVKFDASSSTYKEGNIVAYEYDFGDGSDPYVGGSSVTYKFTDVGTFTVTLKVTGDDGETDTDSLQIVVRPVALTACFTVNTDSGNAPLFVVVDPSCSEGTIGSYEWDFGDGEVSFDRKPDTHTYDTTGTYTITLEVTESDGVVDTFSKTITVN